MELYTARVCPFAHRTRLALLEKSLEFDHIEIDLKDKSERFLEVSPYGKVPALVHEGETLYESAIINEYLEEVFPEPALLPGKPLSKALARIWTHYCDEYFLKDYYAVIRNKDPQENAGLIAKVQANLVYVEKEGFEKLSKSGPYWFGENVSLLDLSWYPFFERFGAWTHYRGLTIPDECPRMKAWVKAMAQRPAVQEIANDTGYYIDGYAGYAGAPLAA